MEEDRIARALARIEAAAGRIEVAGPTAGSTGDQELHARYEALRRETGAALADLDRLLGTLDG